MPDVTDQVPTEARRLWRALAGSDDILQPGTRRVVRGSRGLSPPGWTGVLRLGGAYVIEAGAAADEAVTALLALEDPSDPDQAAPLAAGETLGPGQLAYLPTGAPLPPPPDEEVGTCTRDELDAWLAGLDRDEVDESSAAGLSQWFVARRGGGIVGVVGWETWPTAVAHVGVLVDPAHRAQGIGTQLGRAVLRAVRAAGCTPQWRAAAWNAASRTIATRLGLVEYGRQFSLEAVAAP